MSKVKRNCVRLTERGKQALSVNREPMDKNRTEGVATQGEQANDCKALVTEDTRMSKAMRQMPGQPGRVGVARGEARRDPASDEAYGAPREHRRAGQA